MKEYEYLFDEEKRIFRNVKYLEEDHIDQNE